MAMGESRESLIESLFKDRELYNIFFENADEAILFIEENRIIDCNSKAISLFGYQNKSQFIDQFLFRFSPEFQSDGKKSEQKAVALFSSVLTNSDMRINWEFQKPDRTVFPANLILKKVQLKHHSCIQITIQDVFAKEDKSDELNQVKAFLNGLIETIPQPLFSKDKNFIYNYCNQAFAEYLGKPKDDIIGSSVYQVSDADKAEIYHKADVDAFEKTGNQIYESMVRYNDGKDHHVIFHKNTVTDTQGTKLGIIGLIEDVTAFEANKKALFETESKYKKIFENVQDVFYRTDLAGIITEISPSIERYSKYVNSDIIGKPIENFYVNPDDRNQLKKEIAEKGEASDFEILLKAKNNQQLWTSVNAHFITNEFGQILGIEGSIRDISERKHADDRLKRSISQLQATLDSTTDGILVVDHSGKITNYNKQFKKIFTVPDRILESGDDNSAIEFVLDKLKDPEQFLSKIKYLYSHPELESFDTVNLTDGRIIERFSCPQYLEGIPIGRVWSFRDITLRKLAEEQISLMAHSLKSISECISITDTNDQILFVNQAFINTYGYSQEELIGKNISIVQSEKNDKIVIKNILQNTLQQGWHGEILNRKKDGSEFPISLSTTAIKNDTNEILGMIGVAVDITERKKAELKLKENEERYRSLFEGSPDAILLADVETGIIVGANEASSKLFKRPVSEIIGLHQKEIHPPSIGEKAISLFKADIENSVQGKELGSIENVILCADGSIVPVEVRANLIHINERRILQGVFRDISVRKRNEKVIQESEKKYRNLIETMPDGVYRSTPEGKFLEVNPAMVNILGYDSKEELLAIDIKKELYFNPEDREKLTVQLNKDELDIFPLKKKDGSAVYIEDHGWFVKDMEGNVLFHEGISRDVTDRKKTEIQLQKYSEELQKLNASKDKFFSIIAHDLKSPFNSIIGISEILKMEAKELDFTTIEQYAGIIYSTSSSTFRLLENLLDWAQLQQSSMPFKPVPLILNKVVSEAIELSNEKANSKMIAMINYVPSGLIIKADKNMLNTIIRNLISNALKFTPSKGKVEIRAEIREKEIEISVSDSGKGINPEDIDKLFVLGSKFTRRGTENEKGTGLGLLLCKEFVELHSGKIWVESQESIGSDFKFTISQKI